MSSDDAYIFLRILIGKFLHESGIHPCHRDANFNSGTCCFNSNPQLNAKFAAWVKDGGFDYDLIKSKALHKESRDWELDRKFYSMPSVLDKDYDLALEGFK